MKRTVILLLTLLTALLIMGVDSCNPPPKTWSGKIMKIKQDGTEFKTIVKVGFNKPHNSDYTGFGYMLATSDNRIFYTDSKKLHVIDTEGVFNGQLHDMNPSTMMPSQDGQYVYMQNGRMDLNSMIFTVLFPELSSDAHLGSISEDNRYLCYMHNLSYETHRIRLYDINTMQYQEYITEDSGRSIYPVYVPKQNYIYFVNKLGLQRVRPDGSELSQVIANPVNYNRNLMILHGEDKLLQIADNETENKQEAYLIDLTTESIETTFTIDVPFAFPNKPLICASVGASKIFFLRNNRIVCYDWDSGLEHVVLKGSDRKSNIHSGITCSWDGEQVYFVGAIKD